MATIDRYYFQVCTRGARRHGIAAEPLLRGAGIDPALLDRPGWRGAAEPMARLVRLIVARLGNENMGFTARPLAKGSFAFALKLAAEGTTIADGLRRAARFYNLANRGIFTHVSEADEMLSIATSFADPDLDPDRYFREFWLIGWHRLACWLAADTMPLFDAAFDYPRPARYFEEFRHLFPCPHRFDAGMHRIRIEARAVNGPIRRTAAECRALIVRAPLDIMTIPASDNSIARRVRLALRAHPDLSSDGVAAMLGMPSETLRKRLRREGTTISAIREAWRRDAAIRMLSQGNRSIESIAEQLGYAEARSFTRAFRTWMGANPSRFRRSG